jgi:hypothetical protein
MTQHELDRLRLELRDRDLEIISLRATIKNMRNCENCDNYADLPDGSKTCVTSAPCELPSLKAWEAIK